MPRRLALLLALVLVAGGIAAATPATASAQDNSAVAVNLEDGAELFKFAFKIVRVNRDVVDQKNTAIAYASCESCRTIAVAFQIVLVMSDPSLVTPENVAVAVNEECTSCETLASAYQFVYSVPDKFKFSQAGKFEIRRIQFQLRRLIRSGKPIDEIQAEIDALAARLRTVLRREIDTFEERSKKDRDRDDDDVVEDGGSGEDSDLDEGEEPAETTTVPTETTETETTDTTTEPTETTPTTTTP